MNTLKKYIKPHMVEVIVALVIKFAGAVVELFIPFILAKIVDEIVPTKRTDLVLIWGGVMLLCGTFALVCNIVANRMSSKSSGLITKKLRHDLFEKITYLSAKQIDSITVPTLVSRLTSDTYYVNQLLIRIQRIGVRGPILLIGGIIFTMSMDAVLTLVLVAMLPFIVWSIYIVTKKSVPIYSDIQHNVDGMVRVVQENITGIRVIKALNKTEYEKKKFYKINEGISQRETKVGKVMSFSNPFASLILNIGLTLVVLVGAYRVNVGAILPGTIIAFLTYFTLILNATLGITRIFIIYSKGSASAKRIEDVLLVEEELMVECENQNNESSLCNADSINNVLGSNKDYKNDIDNKKDITNDVLGSNKDYKNNIDNKKDFTNDVFENKEDFVNDVLGSKAENINSDCLINAEITGIKKSQKMLEFRNVCFSYNGVEDNLTDISFELNQGETLGIIGGTGSGKTTLTALMLRMYDANSGEIRVCGKNIKQIDSVELRNTFGIAFQNGFMMAGTIRENIAYGREYSDEEIITACQEAQAMEFIEEKDGLGYLVTSRGTNLSGGQKQRIILARAFVGNPKILVLDDSSGALDYKTDAELRRAISKKVDVTKVIIAQRISSVMHANKILVLENGKCIGYGSHEELLRDCQEYRLIKETQMQSIQE